jgi:predicted GIY-YIG superfamily endonuclease
MAKGFIYLRKDRNAYYIGKTNDMDRRTREYRKENAFITTVDYYATDDMDAAERELKRRCKKWNVFKDKRRNETLRLNEDVLEVFDAVKERHIDNSYVGVLEAERDRAKELKAERERRENEEHLKWCAEQLPLCEAELSKAQKDLAALVKPKKETEGFVGFLQLSFFGCSLIFSMIAFLDIPPNPRYINAWLLVPPLLLGFWGSWQQTEEYQEFSERKCSLESEIRDLKRRLEGLREKVKGASHP